MRFFALATAAAITLPAATALGSYTITQTLDPGPVYAGHSVTFDEPGVPTGVPIDPFDFYQLSDGITFVSGNGFLVADDWDALDGIDGGLGMGNQLNGGFSVNMLFDDPIKEISWQGWANGSPSPPLGGINVRVYLNDVQVASYLGVAPFGGVGDEWFNVVADGGDTFDRVSFYNGAFSSFNSYVDNLSWNVPAPGAFALLGVAGLFGRRRRRDGH
jgi:hypothetical protein